MFQNAVYCLLQARITIKTLVWQRRGAYRRVANVKRFELCL